MDKGAHLGQDTLLQLTSTIDVVESPESPPEVGHMVVGLVSVSPDVCPSPISGTYDQHPCFHISEARAAFA